jgi:hypothetical protein
LRKLFVRQSFLFGPAEAILLIVPEDPASQGEVADWNFEEGNRVPESKSLCWHSLGCLFGWYGNEARRSFEENFKIFAATGKHLVPFCC